jgi:hypothetical protein
MSSHARSSCETTQGILERAKYGNDGSFGLDFVVESNHSRYLAEELGLMKPPNMSIGPVKRHPQHFSEVGSCEATLAASLGVSLSRNSWNTAKTKVSARRSSQSTNWATSRTKDFRSFCSPDDSVQQARSIRRATTTLRVLRGKPLEPAEEVTQSIRLPVRKAPARSSGDA